MQHRGKVSHDRNDGTRIALGVIVYHKGTGVYSDAVGEEREDKVT